MSEREKELHARRLQQKQNYVKRQTKLAKTYNISVPPGQEHRLQDHAALGCSNPKCIFCSNPRKLWKELTIQEKRFYQDKIWEEE